MGKRHKQWRDGQVMREIAQIERPSRKWVWYVLNGVGVVVYIGLLSAIFIVDHRIGRIEADIRANEHKQRQARAMATTERKEEAVLRQKARDNPGDAKAQEEVARYMENHGRAWEAVKYYRQASQLRPEAAELHLALGCLLLQFAGEQKEAVEHLKQVLSLEPDHIQKNAIKIWIKSAQDGGK